MTKARDLANLLDGNGDVNTANLDNVPASNNASALTTGTLPNARLPNNISDGGTAGTKLASGTTAQRGSTAGQLRFNTTTGLAEYYDGTSYKSIDSPPTISSINPTSLGQSVLGSSQSVVITGSSFSNTVIVKIIGNNGTEFTPASTTRNSATQVTITTPTNLTHTNEPYDIKITNASGLSATLADILSINDTPVFSTASGSLGTLADAGRASSNLTAISFSDEESTPTVSVTTGSIPAGLTLNSNGTFSGTANAVSTSATSDFTVTATDGSETATRNYSITVSAPISLSYLSVAGGGGGVGQYQSGGGGAGGMLTGTFAVLSGTTYTATIGAGGSGGGESTGGYNGVNSTIAGSGITTVTSIGGGGGAMYANPGTKKSGGSGGGVTCSGYQPQSGASGTAGQGNDGGATTGGYGASPYQGSGGGGAGAVGVNGANSGLGTGGAGLASSITGSSVIYAGGGGGSNYNGGSASYGLGGTGGGGNGGRNNDSYSGTAGTANLGGGGGSSRNGVGGNSGGSGVIIFSVPTASYSGTTSGSPTISTSGTNTIIKFTGTGSYTG